jgi:hypothetical protein
MNVSHCTVVLAFAGMLCAAEASAQELTPRAYWPAPVGTNLLLTAWQRNAGDVVVDPSLPITGVNSDIDYFQLAFQRALDVFGRSASFQISQPYADGSTQGVVDGVYRQRRSSDLGDTRFSLAVNLRGAPAMDAEGFAALRGDPRTIVGASVIVQAPTGGYDPDSLINVGTNRWAIKPAVGVVVPVRPTWLFEAEVGAWIFGDNDDFLGETRSQDDIISAELHLVKRIRPGFWVSLDANYYTGGETQVGDEIREDLQRNSRAGFTLVFPFRRQHAFRSSYSNGVSTRSGGDFDMFSLSYIYVW